MIFDLQVHLFKNPDGKVHKHLRVLCRYKSTFSVLLTATPMENAHEVRNTLPMLQKEGARSTSLLR